MDFTINSMTLDEIDEFDVFNSKHSHDDDDQCDYNCMAYAFNAYQWINPIDFEWEELDDLIKEAKVSSKLHVKNFSKAYWNFDFNNHFIRRIMILRLLKVFPNLRVINSFDELKDNEYGISFATKEDDYHFVKFEDNKFSHKRGWLPIEEIKSDIEGFRDHGYNSKIIRFAMPKGSIQFKEFSD